MSAVTVSPTPIEGLLQLSLPVHGDERGWFKENWQRRAMVDAGLPDFGPVQNNMSFNASVGVTRGFHAEPWDKLVSVGTGAAFGAWVDLRPGEGFGRVHTATLNPGTAVFVPRGVANAFQTLEPGTLYSYLVNQHWSAQAKDRYTFVNLADPELGVQWPVPLGAATLSEADRSHPLLAAVTPMAPPTTLVLGADGQLGRALRRLHEHDASVRFLGRAQLDLADPTAVDALDLSDVGTVINAAAYTRVDEAETQAGRALSWATNATGVAALARACAASGTLLVHVSSDYVFDGVSPAPAREDTPRSPLGAYGASKAAGELAAAAAPAHYVVRTSWVVSPGHGFVNTMATLARRGVSPAVVNDQVGRLTTADTLARAIDHLCVTRPAYGTYNVTGTGTPMSWAEVSEQVFERLGRDASDVRRVSTEDYGADKALAPRPAHSTLDLTRIMASGFTPPDHLESALATLEADAAIGHRPTDQLAEKPTDQPSGKPAHRPEGEDHA